MRIDHHDVVVRYQVRFNERESAVLLEHPEWRRWVNVNKRTEQGAATIAVLTRTQLRSIAELLGVDDNLLPDLKPASCEVVGEPYHRKHELRYLTERQERGLAPPCVHCGTKPIDALSALESVGR